MNPSLEVFLKKAKITCPNFPDVVTKENVNIPYHKISILDSALLYGNTEVASVLIQMGAKVQSKSILRLCNYKFLEPILEMGIVTPDQTRECYQSNSPGGDRCILFVDYGIPAPRSWAYYVRLESTGRLERYTTLSEARVQECRKALLALLRCCNQSSSHIKGGFAGRAAFGALRSMMIQIATQVWRLKGGEGVGPRAHGWIL